MPKILIAEDDRRVRESLQRALTLEGYEVVTANDGARAIELHTEAPADLLLLDVSMPNADGLSVCRRLRAQGDATPVLMLTARHAGHDRVAGLDAGADDYLVKPFALEELLARLRARLRGGGNDHVGLRVGDLVVKSHPDPPAGQFPAEARGLAPRSRSARRHVACSRIYL